ncbi:MAG: hypothetical protein ACRDJV_00440 [Actinomycetota bacterium]
MPEGGKFVTLAGHLHDGGLRLALRNESSGAPVFVSQAIYEHRWNLDAMTVYSDGAGVPVAAGDVVKLTAVYNDTHNGPGDLAWDNVMGIMMGALAPAD